ncbi:2-amino-4-hydroxy-6-hydroxymethyldihydropteridine diphosphokinase [Kordiimonas sp.]|uniref:2-amino-4-hydroxy-6- hydroxymethyldihydropteridine diphosphokinase n=1 Tax=Kordiimonas sp. TaxID=1970157 RepID=UPI003A9164BE
MPEIAKKIEVFLAFGGNLPSRAGTPKETIQAAVARLETRGFDLVKLSHFYRSPAVTLDVRTCAPAYTNAAAWMQCTLVPEQILAITQSVEREFGRKPGARWTARPLDIDLLAAGQVVLPSREIWQRLASSEDIAAILPEPVVPHPRLHLRGFVLAPLLDLIPGWIHPVLGENIAQLAARAQENGEFEGMKKLGPVGGSGVK